MVHCVMLGTRGAQCNVRYTWFTVMLGTRGAQCNVRYMWCTV